MKCVDFENEFEEQNVLSNEATLHLESCENCKELSFQQNRVWEMLGGLGQVEAPKNFNFGVKARIAGSEVSDFQPQTSFFPALRYVMPLGFVIVLLSFVALSGIYFVDTQSVPTVAVEQSPTPMQNTVLPNDDSLETEVADISEPTEDETAKDNPVNSTEKEVIKPNPKIVAENKPLVGGSHDFINTGSKVFKPVKKEEDGGGSKDTTLGVTKEVLTPKGFDPNSKPKTSVNPSFDTTTDVKEILELSGVTTTSDDNGLKVTSIKKNSVAERSGVKVGDVIEAINGKKITGEAFSDEKTLEIKTLTVLRDGKEKEISLRIGY